MMRVRAAAVLALLCCAVAWWAVLLRLDDATMPIPKMNPSCAEMESSPPPSQSHQGTSLSGIGVFATRRRYHEALSALQNCTSAAFSRIVREEDAADDAHRDEICALAIASSRWRRYIRDDARRAAHFVARRFSHVLDCGARGWLVDCEAKPIAYYFEHYFATRFSDVCAEKPTAQRLGSCAPLCAHLLKQSGRSRPSVDAALSNERERLCRAAISVVAAVAVALVFWPQLAPVGRPGSDERRRREA